MTLNGEAARVPAGLTVESLLRHLQIDAARVAVELNREIVRKPAWTQTPVAPGAEVEIVHFVGGG
ncbi:MAG: sulfur carrier protein ThiS [Bryobacteraceae bacterium]